MQHEEKVINGVLHYRVTASSEWIAYTPASLTERLLAVEAIVKVWILERAT